MGCWWSCWLSCFNHHDHRDFPDTSSDEHPVRSDHSLASPSTHTSHPQGTAVSEVPCPPPLTTAAEHPESEYTSLVDEIPVHHGVNFTDSRDKGTEENHRLIEKIQTGGDRRTNKEECDSLEDAIFCPICLEEYTQDNPKISTQCSHDYHLGCILDWMERSKNCPYCDKVIIIDGWTEN